MAIVASAFQIQKIEIYLVLLSPSQNDETTKRRNDKTTKLARNGSFVDRTIIQERFRSVDDHCFVSNESFAVLSFRSPVASKA